MTLYTTADVARELGISPRLVRRLAQSRKLGTRLNPRMLVFSAEDLDAMRDRRTTKGRPKGAA